MTKKTSGTRIAVLIASLMLSISAFALDNWQEGKIYSSGTQVMYAGKIYQALVTAKVVADSLSCLTKLQSCGSIKPAKAYPDYRGVMTWSINWDKYDG
ncbi:hypothetical protein ACFQNF_00050 [Iodobacter arcticus]|uniref:Uncharacterized protein n=1 Tax=Iodobacter arcticus TaxID=590593 RepID=A0ABW2QRM1_9NEIS